MTGGAAPALTFRDRLHDDDWAAHAALNEDAAAWPKVFDTRDATAAAPYLQCLLAREVISQKGGQPFRVGQPPAFYRLRLAHPDKARAGLNAAQRHELLAKTDGGHSDLAALVDATPAPKRQLMEPVADEFGGMDDAAPAHLVDA